MVTALLIGLVGQLPGSATEPATPDPLSPGGAWHEIGPEQDFRTAQSNTVPHFPDSDTGHRTVEENTAAGTAFGDPVAANDPDTGDTLTYALVDHNSSGGFRHFSINSSTGQLLTKNPLDFETKSTYTLSVRVRDGRGAVSQDFLLGDYIRECPNVLGSATVVAP